MTDDAVVDMLVALPGVVLLAGCVLMRVGAAVALMPGFGERSVPPRIRLAAAIALTALVLPAVAGPLMAAVPRAPGALLSVMAGEALAGLAIGLGFRGLVFALQIAGTTASQSITLSHLFGTPLASEAEPALAGLLAMAGIALAMAAGLHVALVAALVRLYAILPFGLLLPPGDAAAFATARAGEAFALGLSLAMPFVLVGFAYNLALGTLSRAMPQLLVTLVGVPLLVGLGLVTLWIVLPETFARWLAVMTAVGSDPLGPLATPGPAAPPGGVGR